MKAGAAECKIDRPLLRGPTRPSSGARACQAFSATWGLNCQYGSEMRLKQVRVSSLALEGRTRKRRGELVEYIAAVQDVTERRLSEGALDKARSEVANLVTMAAKLGLSLPK
jgi:hypothetical protein